jgi:poly(3-hydroxybutyrate) depolymerase
MLIMARMSTAAIILFLFLTVTNSVTFESTSHFQSSSKDIVVGGMNGPVNFTRPEGERLFYYYVPSTYTPSKPLPFIIYFHGYSGDWMQGVDLNQTVDAENNGYIIAFGQGMPNSALPHNRGWNDGRCCLFDPPTPVDDVTYAKTVVRLVSYAVGLTGDCF